jgi:hypothetical protein
VKIPKELDAPSGFFLQKIYLLVTISLPPVHIVSNQTTEQPENPIKEYGGNAENRIE